MRNALILFICSVVAACAGTGEYIWVDQLPREATSTATDYIINAGDLVNVRVFNQENMGTRAKVRSDGRIAVPILGDVDVRGRKPADLAKDLEARLKPFVLEPHVTVTVEEFQPILVSVVGEVAHAGTFSLDPTSGIVQALAVAGGLTEYADRDRIFVLRRSPTAQRIRFTYRSIVRAEGAAAAFALQPGDVVVAE